MESEPQAHQSPQGEQVPGQLQRPEALPIEASAQFAKDLGALASNAAQLSENIKDTLGHQAAINNSPDAIVSVDTFTTPSGLTKRENFILASQQQLNDPSMILADQSSEAPTEEMATAKDSIFKYNINQSVSDETNGWVEGVEPSSSQEVALFDRGRLKEEGVGKVNNYIERLDDNHQAALGDLFTQAKSTAPKKDVYTDKSLKDLQSDPNLMSAFMTEYPEFKKQYEERNKYSAARNYQKTLNAEEQQITETQKGKTWVRETRSFGTGIDPNNVRGQEHNQYDRQSKYEERLAAARKRLEDAQVADAGSSSENSGSGEEPYISHIEAAQQTGITIVEPTVYPSNKGRREMQRIGDLRRKGRVAGIEAEGLAMWHGADPYAPGPLRPPEPQVDPIRDAKELLSDEALASVTIYRHAEGKNIFGQVVNHKLGREDRVRKEEADKIRSTSHIDEPDGMPKHDSETLTRLDERARQDYARYRQKIEDLTEELNENEPGFKYRVMRRLRRYGRAINRNSTHY